MSKEAYTHIVEPGAPNGPLLFTFHGTGGNETQLLPLGRHVLPDAEIISPRGDVSEHGAARFFRRTGEGVYDMDDLAQRTAKMANFVRSHFEARKPAATVGLGYSNGANILASMLFTDPGLFSAAVLMHPLIPFKPERTEGLSDVDILVTAGRRDPICPPELTLRLEAYLKEIGANVVVEWHDGGHELRQSEIDAAVKFLARFRTTERTEAEQR
ncbi:MAG: alpha/beta hydrolase [Mesorhizobium sp.]|jgi:phospholipase/carboxylesterase